MLTIISRALNLAGMATLLVIPGPAPIWMRLVITPIVPLTVRALDRIARRAGR